MLIYLTILLLCYSCGINSEKYYVIPSYIDRSIYSSGKEYHTLSYYANISNYIKFPPNVTFFFMKGRHQTKYNFILKDLNEVKLQGFTAFVTLNSSSFILSNSRTCRIEGLTIFYHGIDGGGFYLNGSVPQIHIYRLSFYQTKVQVNIKNTCQIEIYQLFFFSGSLRLNQCILYISSSNFVNSFFVSGYSAFGTITTTKFDSTKIIIVVTSHFRIYDCVMNNNNKRFSGKLPTLVYISCSDTYDVLLSNVTIENNLFTGLFVDGACIVKFGGRPSVIANNHSPFNGGGMIIGHQTVITSIGNTTVSFINNTAKGSGGAIYIIDTVVTQDNYCSLSNFHPYFFSNSASIAGNNIYGGVYFGCIIRGKTKYIRNSIILQEHANCSKSDLFKYFPRPISSYVSTNSILVCLCTDINTTDCSKRTSIKEIYPGQDIILLLATVGECGGISASGLVVTGRYGVKVVTYSNQWTGKVCLNFKYGIEQSLTNTTTNDGGQLSISLDPKAKDNLLSKYYHPSPLIINIRFLPCPFGLALSSGICNCNDILTKLNIINQITCNVSNVYPISRSGKVWLYYSHQDNCTVAYTNCPFDYCNASTVHINLNQSDSQCTQNRSGTLCGQCQEGQSVMLGSNQCGYCHNKYLSLIIVFIVAGFLLVLFLLMTNLTISTGSINGLLFYANIIKLSQPVSFDGTSIPVLTQFISWINLDLGIEICFYNGLDDYTKTWLQFIFPLYIWFLMIGIIIGSHYSLRISRYCGNNSVPVLATLVVMSFTKLSRTITKGLMISSIKCDGRHWMNVWSVDGNIEYMSGKHIPLFVVSFISLSIGLIYTVMIFCSQWLQRYGGKYCRSSLDPYVRLKPFIDAHTGPYKDKYRFWTGLLLIIRFILTVVFSYTTEASPQVNNIITVFVSCCLLTFVRGKYNKKYNTILEIFYLSNLFITSLLNILFNSLELHVNQHVNGVSVGLSLGVFICILLVDICIIVKKKCGMKFMKNQSRGQDNAERELLQQAEETSDNNEEGGSPAHVINRRESLLFDFYPSH